MAILSTECYANRATAPGGEGLVIQSTSEGEITFCGEAFDGKIMMKQIEGKLGCFITILQKVASFSCKYFCIMNILPDYILNLWLLRNILFELSHNVSNINRVIQ